MRGGVAVFKIASALAAAVACSGTAHGLTTINTIPTWSALYHGGNVYRSPFVPPLGENGYSVLGQTFTAPEDTLSSFSFMVKDTGVQTALRLGLFAWSGNLRPDGEGRQGPYFSPLWLSGPMLTSGNRTFEEMTLDTANVRLNPGSNYVMLIEVAGLGAVTLAGSCYFTDQLHCPSPQPFDGAMAYRSQSQWNISVYGVPDKGSLAYSAVFGAATAPVPESATWALLVLGFGVIGAARRNRAATRAQVPAIAF